MSKPRNPTIERVKKEDDYEKIEEDDLKRRLKEIALKRTKEEIARKKMIKEKKHTYCIECGKLLKEASHGRVHKKCLASFEDDDGEPKYDAKKGIKIIEYCADTDELADNHKF